LILVALILRGVSFEYRHQGKGQKWTRWFDQFIFWGSVLPPFLWGVAFANLVQGVPIAPAEQGGWIFEGTLLTLLNPYCLLGGLAVMLLCFTHGLVFVALKTVGEMRDNARALATKAGIVTIVVGAVFLAWTLLLHGESDSFGLIAVTAAVAAVALIAAWVANLRGREGWAFTGNTVAITFVLLAVFM